MKLGAWLREFEREWKLQLGYDFPMCPSLRSGLSNLRKRYRYLAPQAAVATVKRDVVDSVKENNNGI